MDKLYIYLTNLTHINNDIPATESIPLNIGYLAAYAKKIFGNQVEIELFNTHTDFVGAVKKKRPHIMAGSNYLWNSHLSYHYLAHYKKQFPEMITVMGGPTFSYNREQRKEFLSKRKALDFYISGEGELAFIDLISACFEKDLDINAIKEKGVGGCHYLFNGDLVSCPAPDRLKELDIIPSPYINGFLDKFLDKGFTPILQSNRGCPFTCAYCCSSVSYYTKMAFFNIDRVKEEIDYIADRVKSPSIHIHDDNFGMFPQDYEICLKFREVQLRYGWPVFISTATGKNSKEKIFRCIELLGASIPFSASVQTTSEEALKYINRKNINLGDFWAIQHRLKEFGANSHSELILPLPGETLESHLGGIKTIMSTGIDSIGPYTTMLLPASPLYEDDKFNKFQMVVKYRVIPRDFGKYEGTNIVEVEKVCVGTRDLPVKDYLYLRGFHFIIYCYYNGETFKELLYYLKNTGCGHYDFCYSLLTRIATAPEPVKKIFADFLSDTRDELWDSEEDILNYYSEDANFSKLLSQEKGCNLLQKYHGLFFSSQFAAFLEYGFDTAKRLLEEVKPEYSREMLQSIYSYIMNSRAGLFDLVDKEPVVELPYDIHAWKNEGYSSLISKYEKTTKIKFCQTEEQKKIIRDYLRIYGNSEDGKGKILTRINPKTLFKGTAVV